mmetsp:Transcript_1359/g.3211  ORF Transcript_1359/g.3211 Transcript_1359/m.3211 type:complete len:92 (-) Transcript_1359:137-412(-)
MVYFSAVCNHIADTAEPDVAAKGSLQRQRRHFLATLREAARANVVRSYSGSVFRLQEHATFFAQEAAVSRLWPCLQSMSDTFDAAMALPQG